MNETMERNQMVQAYRTLSARDRILFQTILDLVVVLIIMSPRNKTKDSKKIVMEV